MFAAVVLGLIQGLTEFLPVSSSGHLVVVPALAGWEQPSVTFALLLHVATLAAVVVYFRRDLAGLVAGRRDDREGARRLAGLLAVGTLPAAVAGLALEGLFTDLFERPRWVAVFWVVTAAALFAAERRASAVPRRPLGVRTALVVGLAQAAAIAPGISRSGATIAAGLASGLSRDEAARFSFLLSIPVIAGGGLTLVPEVASGRFRLDTPMLAGMAVAAASGYVAVAGLLRLVRTRTLVPFAVYLVVAAPAAALALS